MELAPHHLAALAVAIFVVAVVYSAVGQAGASGYLAVLSLFNIAPAAIKPTALALNILVAAFGVYQFSRAGYFSWRMFWPFAVLSAPLAFAGGSIDLPAALFRGLVGATLLLSAAWLLLRTPDERTPASPSRIVAIISGGCVGLLAGFTGTGGGIFLSPLLLTANWANVQTAAALTAMFALVNSLAALAGNLAGARQFPPFALVLMVAAGLGGLLGSYLGSRRLSQIVMTRCLAAVLLVAGVKLILTPSTGP